jgi:hypothetical protein
LLSSQPGGVATLAGIGFKNNLNSSLASVTFKLLSSLEGALAESAAAPGN